MSPDTRSCMFCGEEDWSTFVCQDCETKINSTSLLPSPYAETRHTKNIVTIVVPEYSTDQVSEDLRELTKKLMSLGHETSGGLLGGEYGYGAYFENHVFMMHPYCWCEEDDCAWCVGCSCPESAHDYMVEGKISDFDEWLASYDKNLPREIIYHEELQCDYCKGLVGNAPNFLHKSSQTSIRWYKYIGRSMEIDLHAPWDTIIQECFDSL